MILSASESTHLLWRVKLLGEVIPSPVGPAIVKVVQPSALKPIPAYDGAFLTNIVVQIAFAYCVIWSTFFE